ncbi:carbohydrate-binding family 6 protein [Fulvivirga sp. M361]|uniref:carbohydrate-binding family 6 protein n=1 Tax=Fulvivirga sp. M361 TaxID=2594266 RepID=UPI00117ACEB5|nr:carbohydrate-binding family 6 protein [Fulvivirga sp. M361]TRX45873.1 carbohydrate-binding family 6 protein [Fulvivirga sp. M361]
MRVKSALIANQIEVTESTGITLSLLIEKSCCAKGGYKIERISDDEIVVRSGDATGLMYGGLELAELINISGDLEMIHSVSDQPYIVNRGIKFNIPLDVRTSSFDDSGDAAQENIAEMWDLGFWQAFFDNMARHRYNAITYWNAHPFSSMVKLEDYPDVALQDVCGTTIKPQEHPYYWNTPELPSSKIVDNLKVEKKMTIEEKIKFWQKVMEHASNRGIDVYFITWNICLNGTALPGPNKEVGDKPGKYGISNNYKNETSIDYLRKSVKQFVLTYPHLTGIGVTAGENMRTPMNDDDKERWLWETYGLGIIDAKKEQPDRVVKFIHRFWWTDMEKVMKYWGQYPDPFDMSFKYAKAHMYSAVAPPFHKPLLKWMKPQNLKSWWNLRNDDIFIHRWGDPKFASEFIKNLPKEQTAGFHMGSDGYVWGREFISKQPETPRQLEIDKHWYRFMLWGRLSYNPDIPNDRFKDIIATKFPETDKNKLFQAWTDASKIIPQINRFHWRDWDYMWAPEACMDTWNDLRDINAFRENTTMEESGILNPVDYVKAVESGKNMQEITPLDVANNLSKFGTDAIKTVNSLLDDKNSKELQSTLLDIKSMSFLGHYYANKIKAAVELEFFKVTGQPTRKNNAIQFLNEAVICWQDYTNINKDRYKRQNLARLRTFDFENQLKWVKKDIEIAKAARTYEQDSTAALSSKL